MRQLQKVLFGFVFILSGCVIQIMAQGLLGHWPLDETSGNTIQDISGNKYNAIANSGGVKWTTGKISGGYSNAAPACESVYLNYNQPFFPAKSNLSMTVWVKHDSIWNGTPEDSLNKGHRYVTILYYHPTYPPEKETAVLRYDRRNLDFYIRTDDSLKMLSFQVKLNKNEWYHVGGTWDGTTMRLYLNGIEVGNKVPGGTIPSATALVIVTGGEQGLKGTLDDIRLYKGVLSVSSMESLYTAAGNVRPGISADSLSTGNAGTAYLDTVRGFGGLKPYKWSVRGNPLPVGLTLNSATGVISGTPAIPRVHNISFQLIDANNDTTVRIFPMKINGTGLSGASSPVFQSQLNPLEISTLAGGGLTIDCQLSSTAQIELILYGIDGQILKKMYSGIAKNGRYSQSITSKELADIHSGVVIVSLKAGKEVFVRKIQKLN